MLGIGIEFWSILGTGIAYWGLCTSISWLYQWFPSSQGLVCGDGSSGTVRSQLWQFPSYNRLGCFTGASSSATPTSPSATTASCRWWCHLRKIPSTGSAFIFCCLLSATPTSATRRGLSLWKERLASDTYIYSTIISESRKDYSTSARVNIGLLLSVLTSVMLRKLQRHIVN